MNLLSNKIYKKSIRDKLINYLYYFIDNSIIPNNVWLMMIRSWHFMTPYTSIYSYLYAPLYINVIVLFTMICTLMLYIYFEGCFISILEYKLEKNKEDYVNIIDPWVYLLSDKEANTENRYKITAFIAMNYFILAGLIFYYRFIKY